VSSRLLVMGVSHRTTPLALRERLAVDEDRVASDLKALMQSAGLKEAVLLSTCNRVELFGLADSPDRAAAGTLNVLAAGDPAAIAQVQPLFDAVGQKTWLLGAEPHQANVVKLAMNFLLASAIEAMAEAAALGERHEVDPAKLVDVITGTLFTAPAYAVYGKLIVDREFKPGFKLTLGLKDVRLALAAGEASGVPLPFASIIRDNLVDAIAHGDAEKDWSAVALVARRRAGLDGKTNRH